MARRHRLTTAASIVLALAAATLATTPKVNGKLEQIGPFRVLRVWGTPQEMGFAHGYLLGDAYLAPAKEYYSHPKFLEMEKHRDKLLGLVTMPERTRQELEGLYRGIVAAAGKVPTIAGLDRPLELDDLIFDNSYDLFRAFGCSGFTVWGDRAGDAGVITGRNFDFHTSGPIGLAQQMILVRQPEGLNQVASVTWPGIIAVFTGINEHGVCAFVHDGNGKMIRQAKGRYTPLLPSLKEFLETAKPANAHARAETRLQGISPYPFSYLVRVITPRVPGQQTKPVRVFRIDAAGLSENPRSSLSCVTTNHYLTPGLVPMNGADGWSLHRYTTLAKRMSSTSTVGGAWEALRAVERESSTLHSVVVLPERRELHLAFADWHDGFRPATRKRPTRITFDQLFGPPVR